MSDDEDERALSEWDEDCRRHHGRILTGARRHWCPEWDFMPVDETTTEFEACTCYAPGGVFAESAKLTGKD